MSALPPKADIHLEMNSPHGGPLVRRRLYARLTASNLSIRAPTWNLAV